MASLSTFRDSRLEHCLRDIRHSALNDMDCAVELLLCLSCWNNLKPRTQLTTALKTFHLGLDKLHGYPMSPPAQWSKAKHQACSKLLRNLNSTVNEVISTLGEHSPSAEGEQPPSTQGEQSSSDIGGMAGAAEQPTGGGLSGDGIEAPANDPRSGASRATPGGGVDSVAESRTRDSAVVAAAAAAGGIIFDRAISSHENTAFEDLFKIVEATPRKIKRVVNM